MRLEQLKYLVDIAQTRSITSTSQRYYVTQQAVSKSIKQLEVELDTEILIRSNSGVSFTEAGGEVVNFAIKVLAEEQALNKKLKMIKKQGKDQVASHIAICSTSSVTNIVLPTIISNYAAQQKRIYVNIYMTDSFDVVLERIQNKESDLGLITINEQEFKRQFDAIQEGYEYEVLARDEMVAVLDKKLYRGMQDYISLHDLGRSLRTLYNIIPIPEYQNDAYRATLTYSNDADFHRTMMEKTNSITLMPGLAHQYFFNSKKYVALSIADLDVTLIHVALYRKDASVRVKNFATMIKREMHMN